MIFFLRSIKKSLLERNEQKTRFLNVYSGLPNFGVIFFRVCVDKVHDHLVVGVLLVPLPLTGVKKVVTQWDQDHIMREERTS